VKYGKKAKNGGLFANPYRLPVCWLRRAAGEKE
jgi:hypothetical protein